MIVFFDGSSTLKTGKSGAGRYIMGEEWERWERRTWEYTTPIEMNGTNNAAELEAVITTMGSLNGNSKGTSSVAVSMDSHYVYGTMEEGYKIG